jgi:hypothetical protein
MGQRITEGFYVRGRVLCTPHMNSCLCVNWMLVSEMCFFCTEKTTPSSAEYEEGGRCI